MPLVREVSGISVAIAAATLFGGLMTPALASGETARCFGVNDCRGRGACATANNQCAGQNACRGQGVLEMSREACENAGGRVDR